MKANRFDIATDILKKRLNNAFNILTREYKGTKPYRKEKVPDDEVIAKYIELLPRRDELRQTMPGWYKLEQEALKLIYGGKQNA